jgi:transposase-like protein
LRAHRDKTAARRYFEKSIPQNGEPEAVTIDKSGANLAALEAINAERETPIKIRFRADNRPSRRDTAGGSSGVRR